MTLSAQFIIQDCLGDTAAELLRRRPVWIPRQFPARVGAPDCDYILPGATSELFQLRQTPQGQLWLWPAKAADILLNGLPCPDSGQLLRSGDCIQAYSQQMHYYAILPKTKPSFSSLLLARLAKIWIWLFLLLQVWFFLFLPMQVQNSRLWERAMNKQQISAALDQLRDDLKAMPTTDSSQEALQNALLSELDARANYMRQHEDRLTRSQRRTMLADLRRIRRISDHLQESQPAAPLPTLEIDRAVKALTNPSPVPR